MVKAIEIKELLERVEKNPDITAVDSLLKKIDILSVKGLQGSSRSLLATSLIKKSPQTYLYILNDAESAGYFYHDITQIIGSQDVLFFPSAYKRAAKYGQLDAANEVLRTAVLSRLQENVTSLIIVSYPDALIEKTVSNEHLKEHTLTVSVGEQIDSSFVSEVLDDYGFRYVDYVYEPGQYAQRGSILDLFSYSSEFPYRIDFFGDEVESIRNFDMESQLSIEKFNDIRIVPELSKTSSRNSSLFSSLPNNSILGIEDMRWILSRIDSLNEDELHIDIDLENVEYVKADFISSEEFSVALSKFTQLRFDAKFIDTPNAVVNFKTSPQPLYHKNFDLLSDSLHQFMDEGYTIYILSDSEKQQKRLFHIFEDRNDSIPFIPVNKTLHEGFSDATTKICCFTDHQIFDRFHKYNLKSDKARSGKVALTLKELNQLQTGDYVVHMDHGIGKFS